MLRAIFLVSLSVILGACAPAEAPSPDAGASTDNASCASCHPSQSAALANARHGHASDSEVFTSLRARTDAEGQAFCDRCHAEHREEGFAGVGCVSCHQAVGNHGTSNGRLTFDRGGTMYGPITDPAPNSAHGSAHSDFIQSADFCGTCHEVSAGGAFVETPFSEWTASGAAMNNVTCADCHMSPAPGDDHATRTHGTAAEGGPDRTLSSHDFIGPDDDRAPELLARAAAVTVATVSSSTTGIEIDVRVQNLNPAHALPSGARFAREVWLEVTAVDGMGNSTVISGGLDARGAPLADDTMRVDLADAITLRGVYALPTEADTHVVRAIPAGQIASFRYALPASIDGVSVRSVRARLRYRRYAFALLDALGLTTAPYPAVDLAAGEATINP